MISRQPIAMSAIAIVIMATGCSSYYKDINDVTGVTEEDLKKSMEAAASEGPQVVQTTAEETMELLLDPDIGSSAADVLKATKRRLIGKVLEVSPEGSETQFVVLDGGMHRGQACKIKCTLAKDQGAALKEIQAGDEIRITGSSDAVVKNGVLEMKECVLDDRSPTPAAKPK